jgi:protein-tyrosine phosphatase
VFDFFKSKPSVLKIWPADMHSHILPGIDDGSKSLQESLDMLKIMRDLGIQKWVTTPHIFSDFYPNTPEIIKAKLTEVQSFAKKAGFDFDLQAAAEYYLDENLFEYILTDKELLSFGKGYLLFETNMLAEPQMLNDFIFQIGLKGLMPVMAHPERYDYLAGNFNRVEDLRDRGVYFQLNALSLTGHYSRTAQRMARALTDKNLVDFVGTDCHNPAHAALLNELSTDKHFRILAERPLLNYSI